MTAGPPAHFGRPLLPSAGMQASRESGKLGSSSVWAHCGPEQTSTPDAAARPLAVGALVAAVSRAGAGRGPRGLWTQLLEGWWAGQAGPCGRPESSSVGASKVPKQLQLLTVMGSFLCMHLCRGPGTSHQGPDRCRLPRDPSGHTTLPHLSPTCIFQ